MPVAFGPSDDTASLIGMILSLTLLNGPRNTSRNTFGKHNPQCHLQMPTKALSCKKETICEHGLWAKAHLKWTVSKWKSILWSDESKFDILVGNHGPRVLWAKEEGDFPAFYQRSVQKPVSLMAWGCISIYGMGSLHVLEGTLNAERYIKVLEQHAPLQMTSISAGHAQPHTAAITTAWLSSQVKSPLLI